MTDITVMYENAKFQDNGAFVNSDRLQVIYNNFKSSISKYHSSKHSICFYLNQLKEFFDSFEDKVYISFNYGKVTGLNGEYNFLKFVEEFFNISKSTAYRYLQLFDKFFKDNFPVYFKDILKEFDISKLVELLVLDNDIIRNALSSGKLKPIMTFKEIRKFVLNNRGAATDSIIEEEMFEEPEKYIPGKHYEKQYYNSLSKGELVNYIYELQTYCEELKSKKTIRK